MRTLIEAALVETTSVDNGAQPAAVAYRRDEHGTHRAFGVAVLDTTSTGIARIVAFGDPSLVERFGQPPVLDSRA